MADHARGAVGMLRAALAALAEDAESHAVRQGDGGEAFQSLDGEDNAVSAAHAISEVPLTSPPPLPPRIALLCARALLLLQVTWLTRILNCWLTRAGAAVSLRASFWLALGQKGMSCEWCPIQTSVLIKDWIEVRCFFRRR